MNQQTGIIVIFTGISVILFIFFVLGIIDNYLRKRYEKYEKMKKGNISKSGGLAMA